MPDALNTKKALESLTEHDVAIVLCSFNGEAHIQAQLESLLQQSVPFTLLVFDDQSTDNTQALVNQLIKRSTNQQHKTLSSTTSARSTTGACSTISYAVQLQVNAENLGYVANFEQGINVALQQGFKYIALCDQDDIWDTDRLAQGLTNVLALELAQGASTPLLAHSDLSLINDTNHAIHHSFLKYRHYSINDDQNLALVLGQNGVMGNTTVFNRALAELALPFPAKLHVHDYWLAVIAELFGQRTFIAQQLVAYRIHNNNASNSDNSVKFGLQKLLQHKSIKGFINRDFRLPFKEDSRLGAITALLDNPRYSSRISKPQKQTLELFKAYLTEQKPSLLRFIKLLKLGFFKKGVQHKLRVAFSYFTTNRYKT